MKAKNIFNMQGSTDRCGLPPPFRDYEQLSVFSPSYLDIDMKLYQNLEICEVGTKYKFGSINIESHNGNRDQARFPRIFVS